MPKDYDADSNCKNVKDREKQLSFEDFLGLFSPVKIFSIIKIKSIFTDFKKKLKKAINKILKIS